MMPAAETGTGGATIVTQTRIRTGREDDFARWQQQIAAAVAELPGFLEQTIMPPNPPAQIDWVILQRFATLDAATSWLRSDRRMVLIEQARPMLAGQDDIHILRDDAAGVLPSPVSTVIATRLKPGAEAAYRAWEHKMAIAQARARGFQGYRFEPPIPGVQENWLAILRFDSDASLQQWMDSPERLALIKEAEPFTEEFHARIVRTGFDQWFKPVADGRPAPAWKMNMLVLLMLYPIVFVFGELAYAPMTMVYGVPVWLALFTGNVASIILLNYAVPWVSRRFGWWLGRSTTGNNLLGTGYVVAGYAISLAVFAAYSRWFPLH